VAEPKELLLAQQRVKFRVGFTKQFAHAA
jgi:hypothetical protein